MMDNIEACVIMKKQASRIFEPRHRYRDPAKVDKTNPMAVFFCHFFPPCLYTPDIYPIHPTPVLFVVPNRN